MRKIDMGTRLKGIKVPPKPMKFTYPEKNIMIGLVVKETGELLKTKQKNHGDYYFVCQLIKPETMKTKDGKKYPLDYDEEHIRFGYYRRKPGSDKFIWGSQTAYMAPVRLTKRLLKKSKEKNII